MGTEESARFREVVVSGGGRRGKVGEEGKEGEGRGRRGDGGDTTSCFYEAATFLFFKNQKAFFKKIKKKACFRISTSCWVQIKFVVVVT